MTNSERSRFAFLETAWLFRVSTAAILLAVPSAAQGDATARRLADAIKSTMERFDLPSLGMVVRGGGDSLRAAFVMATGKRIERRDEAAFDIASLFDVLVDGRADPDAIIELERRARGADIEPSRRLTAHRSSWEGRRLESRVNPDGARWFDLDGLDRLSAALLEAREVITEAPAARPRLALGFGGFLRTGRFTDGQFTTITTSSRGMTVVLAFEAKTGSVAITAAGLADADAALVALAHSALGGPERAREDAPVREQAGAAEKYDRTLWSDGSVFIELRRRPDHWILDTGHAAFRLRAPEGADSSLDPRTGRLDITIDGRGLRIGAKTYARIEAPDAAVPSPELLGQFADESKSTVSIAERYGSLWWVQDHSSALPMELIDVNRARLVRADLTSMDVVLVRDARKLVTRIECNGRSFARLSPQPGEGDAFRITPRRTIEELRAAAEKAKPPRESKKRAPTRLVDLATVNRSIRFDIRYATRDNFMGEPFYETPRAFMVEDAAKAVGRAASKLERIGIGLLIHDAYRPWSVTHMFWNATPPEQREFVANPANGSRHNRGCAVDTGLYDLATKKKIAMPSGYDEFTERAWPDWQGGTTTERNFRETLRRAMEEQGFRVYDVEWWHFDYEAWREYPIRNESFAEIDGR